MNGHTRARGPNLQNLVTGILGKSTASKEATATHANGTFLAHLPTMVHEIPPMNGPHFSRCLLQEGVRMHDRNRYLTLVRGWIFFALIFIGIHQTAYAETYIAAQFGATFPQALSDVNITTAGFTSIQVSDIDLDNSFVFGGKVGHYFRSVQWLGLETEAFVSNPNVKQQDLTFSGPGGSVTIPGVAGFDLRVINWAPVNVMLRLPGRRLQPYLGAGLGIFFARLRDKVTADTQSSTALGLNAQAGLRYYIVRHVAIFAEGKFTGLTRFKFEETTNLDGFDADYNAISALAGIGYHF